MTKLPVQDEMFGMIPVLTTPAGRCLTAANWKEAGVKATCYYLSDLLLKPGYGLLTSLPNLGSYTAWQDTMVLNASLPKANKEGIYTLRSHYDGSQVRHTADEILTIITQLKPQIAILPQGMFAKNTMDWQTLPETMLPFFPVIDLPENHNERRFGVYFYYDEATTPMTDFLHEVASYKHLPCYVAGDLSLALMQALAGQGVQYLESDRPAADACLGDVYIKDGIISLQDAAYAMCFDVIDKHCHCPTCDQQFTQAYLHHLLAQTPLLCQRMLIQHNIQQGLLYLQPN